MFTGFFEDIFGCEAVPVRESTKGFGGPGIRWLIARDLEARRMR